MNSTKSLILLILLCFICKAGSSQTLKNYAYTFDASGNRIARNVIILQKRAFIPDSIYSPIEKQQKQSEIFKENLEDREIVIYPNPTKGILNVNIKTLANDQIRIRLYDIQGKVLMDYNHSGTQTELNLSGQPAGIYLLQVFINNKQTSWKIIKQD